MRFQQLIRQLNRPLSDTISLLIVILGAVVLRLLVHVTEGVAPSTVLLDLTVKIVEATGLVGALLLAAELTLRGIRTVREEWRRTFRQAD